MGTQKMFIQVSSMKLAKECLADGRIPNNRNTFLFIQDTGSLCLCDGKMIHEYIPSYNHVAYNIKSIEETVNAVISDNNTMLI